MILKSLILKVFELVLNFYKDIVEKQKENQLENHVRLTQNQSLQMLFDLKFLYSLFDIKSNLLAANLNEANKSDMLLNIIDKEFKHICDELESFVDPFDYDICSPFIQSNVSKSMARTAVSITQEYTLYFLEFNFNYFSRHYTEF